MSDVVVIKNSKLRVEISKLGAELYSVRDLESGEELLWQGDPAYWKSRSPVLFPIVGRIYNNTCRVEGKEYTMLQHGIARHLPFEVAKHSDTEVILILKSSQGTRESYPYDFVLSIGYRLEGHDLTISYRVENPSGEVMHFQLGAHPGFNYRNFSAEAEIQGYFRFNDMGDDDSLSVNMINGDGYLVAQTQSLALREKRVAITKDTFNSDALILENTQSRDISLLDSEGQEYIRVRYDAPVVGLWSKARGEYAPFVCIEPWWGRCDRLAYEGEFRDKDWMQSLGAGESFEREIVITIN